MLSQVLCIIFIAINEYKLESRNNQIRSKEAFFSRVNLKFGRWPWKTIGHLSHATLFCASFHIHWWIQTGVTVHKRPNWVNIDDIFVASDLEIWQMTDENNKTTLLHPIKRCVSCHCQMWVTIRKRLNWVLASVTLIFDLWTFHLLCGHHFCQW